MSSPVNCDNSVMLVTGLLYNTDIHLDRESYTHGKDAVLVSDHTPSITIFYVI